MSITFYKSEIVEKARIMRKRDYSFRHIARVLSIGHGTAQRWCLDIPSHNQWFLRAMHQHEEIKKLGNIVIDNLKINKNNAKLIASLLYWGEGTKYPHSTAVSFSNSDPLMIKTFIYFLRKGFSLDERKFKIHLQIHTTHSRRSVFKFWSTLLKIPLTQFWKLGEVAERSKAAGC